MPFKKAVLRLITMVIFVLLLAFVGGTKPGASASLPQLQITPDPCGPAITRPRDPLVNVRSGPSTSYPIIAQAGANDLPILGRHHAFRWWQVSLPDGTIGWVSDEVVVVSGYIDGVPLVEAPDINGFVPDVNEEWVPFVQAPCTATPPPTPSSPTGTATVSAIGVLGDVWSPPLNLSQSGAARNPVLFVESAGVGHVIWQEEAASNFLYVHGRDGDWSTPLEVELPFGTRRYFPELREDQPTPLFHPQLLIDATDRIHALWLDDDGTLFHSDVAGADDFVRYDAWSPRQQLAEDVVTFDAALDVSARLHVTYLSSRDLPLTPAGVYYLRTDTADSGLPELLYSSRYFQALTADQANVEIAVGDGESADQVYVSWDNRPLDALFFTSSADGGQHWDDGTVVERRGPGDLPEAMTPSNLMVATSGDGVLLLWQADHAGIGCRQYYRWSTDGGRAWQGPHLLESLPGCYTHGRLLPGDNGSILLLAHLEDGSYLLAWDRESWSEPQFQDALTEFVNAETLRTVQFDCYQGQFRSGHLLVVGCSSGEVNDIWVTSRDVESTTSWFSPPVWSQPAAISGSNLQVATIELVATGDGLIHAFFSQPQDPGIYYTRWDGVTWSRVTLLLKVPEEEAGWPVVVAGPGNELFLIARSIRGSLYFSLAKSSEAVAASGWSAVTPLPIPHDGKVSPADVAWDANGTVYIAYSVPVNDERGIYLVQSTDQGRTWSEPLQLFNGAAAGFDLVGSPSLLVSADGFIHITWNRQSPPVEGVSQPLSLYYTRSEDGGHTFSEAELVVETPVAWQEIVAGGMNNLHRLWRQPDTMTTIWDQVSIDRGHSWQVAQRLPDEWGTTALTVDPVGRLHLIGVGLDSLGHWLWDGSQWQAEAPLRWSLASQGEDPVELLAAAVNKDGKMVVVLAKPPGTDEAVDRLLYTTRTLNLPPPQTPIEEAPTRSTSPTYTPATPSPEPSLTPVAVEPWLDSGSDRLQSPINRFLASAQFAVAFLPTGLILLVVLGRRAIRAIRTKAR